jgi:leader peptidase (prepilin peptidase)/N-methyltransferase
MIIVYYVLVFIAGAVIGSFLNVVIDRLPDNQSLIKPPSHCSACNTRLSVKDLIPIVSYIWLRGKCRYCGAHIPLRILLVELITGLLFILIFWKIGITPQLPVLIIYSCVFVVITVIDLEKGIIPNRITYPFIIIAILVTTFLGSGINNDVFLIDYSGLRQSMPFLANLFDSLIGGILAFVFLLLIVIVSRGGMGLGDVKLAAMIGFMTAFPVVILALFLGIISGGIVAAVLLITRRKQRKDTVPFGPFLCFGALLALLWGSNILNWYLGY